MARDTIDFLFLDDLSAKHVNSVSIGDVWLYFYKETLIGIRDMDSHKIWLLKIESWHPDGYSHRHEITHDIIEKAFKAEPYPYVLNAITHMTAEELSSNAIELIANSIVQHINRAMKP